MSQCKDLLAFGAAATVAHMIIPVRCFSCGKVCEAAFVLVGEPIANAIQVTGDLWERYVKLVETDGIRER